MALLGARRLREALDRHGIRPTKTLGQNFVIDPNTIRKVVAVAGIGPEDRVLEIGAGAGSLTLGLAAAAAHVIAIEFDRKLVPVLEEMLSPVDNVEVVVADALELDLSTIDATKLVANLPYNIAVPVVVKVLEGAPGIGEMVVMTQREVGERMVAGPGTKAYGQVSLVVGYFATAEVAARVSRRAFYPVPGVDSVLVRMVRRRPPDVDPERLFPVVRAAFSQRRKTLKNALTSSGIAVDDDHLEQAGLASGIRGEQLELDDFLRLVRLLGPPAGPPGD
ncbi:MAG TPA: 16S rRNA (adenine(1518)-N(6)/adenine(1519)-N(6))-dimethyltransferase RsmA [Actinomycetota bacterium]|nr:16S rRNA (adenine(1518)-N(6)/adenine(1519)-N(6))-dimethyltransferase RsmA [Actinomycetota bacterium]